MTITKWKKTRNQKRKSRKTRRASKRSRRHHRKQRGGTFAYEIPSSAVVIHRSMDDDMFSPPTLMTKADMDEMVSQSERA